MFVFSVLLYSCMFGSCTFSWYKALLVTVDCGEYSRPSDLGWVVGLGKVWDECVKKRDCMGWRPVRAVLGKWTFGPSPALSSLCSCHCLGGIPFPSPLEQVSAWGGEVEFDWGGSHKIALFFHSFFLIYPINRFQSCFKSIYHANLFLCWKFFLRLLCV